MRLIAEQVIDAHLLEGEDLVGLLVAAAGEPLLQAFDFLFDPRAGDAVVLIAGNLLQYLAVFVDLVLDDLAFELVRDRDLPERGVRHDDAVEVIGRGVGDELLAPVGVKPLLIGNHELRGRVLLVELLGELP